jgi:hypothetical protein
MSFISDVERIPILWINLNRALKRRACMQWALDKGGWTSHRFVAVDANNRLHRFVPIPSILNGGSSYPGLFRAFEASPNRSTSRAELACLASWKRLLLLARQVVSPSGWYLVMEDDLGACLSVPEYWAHSLHDLISFCPPHTLAIQLAPISSFERQRLFNLWHQSSGQCLAVNKSSVCSHGNGAVLLHQRALPFLVDSLLALTSSINNYFHPFFYPWRIRPVADKWLYASLPPNSCFVATYPHFCLTAEDSDLHPDHVHSYHRPSRDITLDLWRLDQRHKLIEAVLLSDLI